MLPPFLVYGIIAAILSGILCSSIGTFVTLRGLSFMGAGIAHAALAGAALALLMGLRDAWAVFGLGLLFAIPLAVIVGYVGERGLRMDIAVGIMFAMDMALAVLFIGMLREYTIEAWSLIFGDVLGVSDEELILLGATCAVVEFFILTMYKEFKFVTFDFEGALASGVRARMVHYVMMLMIALTVVSVLKSVGALLVFALIVAPPLAAYELTHCMERMLALSVLIGATTSLLGMILALELNTPASATIALIATAVAGVLTIMSPRRRKCCQKLVGRVLTLKGKHP